jgi:hypothetical protein
VIRAQLEDSMSAEEVVELAAAGRLYGLEPFDISPSQARELRAEAERERPTNGGPKTELDRTRAIAEATIARVEALEAPTAKDLHAAREAARIIRDAEKQQERESARRRASQPRDQAKPKCQRLADEFDWPENAEPCGCPDDYVCLLFRIVSKERGDTEPEPTWTE